MQTNPTTRRALLTGGARVAAYAAGAAIVGGAVAVADAKGATFDRSAWETGLARIAKAKAEDEAFEPTYQRVRAACDADMPSEDMIPWGRFPYFEHNALAHHTDLDVMERNIRDAATGLPGEPARWLGNYKDTLAAIEKVREFRALKEAAHRKHNMRAVEREWDRRGEAYYDARWALFNMPAPDLAALRWKAEHLFGEATRDGGENDRDCPSWAAHVIDAYMADLTRLLPVEA